jgi:hypothetical protein
MSSLAAVQADGFYQPPEWDPQKTSLRKFVGSKGHNQYMQYGEWVLRVIDIMIDFYGMCPA